MRAESHLLLADIKVSQINVHVLQEFKHIKLACFDKIKNQHERILAWLMQIHFGIQLNTPTFFCDIHSPLENIIG